MEELNNEKDKRLIENFKPDNMLKFTVAKKGEESFYFHVKLKNKKVNGMFLVSNPDPDVDPIISLFIEDPEKKIVFNRLKKSMGQF